MIRYANPVFSGTPERYEGFYIATTYEAVKQVFSDFRTYTSSKGTGLPPLGFPLLPIDSDPPFQLKLRRILNPTFTTDEVIKLRTKVETVVDKLIDTFIESGQADLSDRLIRPTLYNMVLPLIGVPLKDQPHVSAWVDYMIRRRVDDPQGVVEKTELLAKYLDELIQACRNSNTGSSVLSTLVRSSIDGAPLSTQQLISIMILILFGGLDTTSAVMAEALLYLSHHPEDRRRLEDGDVDWAGAIEEFIRMTSPVQGQRRVTVHKTTLSETELDLGESVFALNAAANRDPSHFENPNTCIIDRKQNDHLAFGAGAHICLGRNLARLEIEVLIKKVLDRLKDYKIQPDFAPQYTIGEARGMIALPVTFTPGKPLT